ncbi:hypothetical protein FK530_23045 [Tsukamurella conjunctivitidis]|uniref:Uncharacterized protein n=1 Tax=Tsukamurella conjunctivitidis TaxID=2592068 RepID=A0A5C5RRB1_9ACTN|nr:hypothetical protein [Tsukamurella conjunctivitidis]TWS25599.1 hypothetical protein FK530_23045 [Tsukamurella conjunctivitidis]
MTDTHETDQLVAVLTDALEIYGRPDDGLPQHLAAVIRRELWSMEPAESALASLESIINFGLGGFSSHTVDTRDDEDAA